MTLTEKTTLLIAAIISLAFTAHLFHTANLMVTLIIGLAALGAGTIFWFKTSLKHPTNPKLLLPPFFLTAAFLMIHIAEEYVFDFGNQIAGIAQGIWTTEQFLWSLGILFPIVWILGAYAIAKRHPFGGFVSCFIFLGMLLGEPTHLLIFPIREAILHGGGYDYFPGMWTALAPLTTGLWGIAVIVTEARKDRQMATSGAVTTG
jgi:hypothetical protein